MNERVYSFIIKENKLILVRYETFMYSGASLAWRYLGLRRLGKQLG